MLRLLVLLLALTVLCDFDGGAIFQLTNTSMVYDTTITSTKMLYTISRECEMFDRSQNVVVQSFASAGLQNTAYNWTETGRDSHVRGLILSDNTILSVWGHTSNLLKPQTVQILNLQGPLDGETIWHPDPDYLDCDYDPSIFLYDENTFIVWWYYISEGDDDIYGQIWKKDTNGTYSRVGIKMDLNTDSNNPKVHSVLPIPDMNQFFVFYWNNAFYLQVYNNFGQKLDSEQQLFNGYANVGAFFSSADESTFCAYYGSTGTPRAYVYHTVNRSLIYSINLPSSNTAELHGALITSDNPDTLLFTYADWAPSNRIVSIRYFAENGTQRQPEHRTFRVDTQIVTFDMIKLSQANRWAIAAVNTTGGNYSICVHLANDTGVGVGDLTCFTQNIERTQGDLHLVETGSGNFAVVFGTDEDADLGEGKGIYVQFFTSSGSLSGGLHTIVQDHRDAVINDVLPHPTEDNQIIVMYEHEHDSCGKVIHANNLDNGKYGPDYRFYARVDENRAIDLISLAAPYNPYMSKTSEQDSFAALWVEPVDSTLWAQFFDTTTGLPLASPFMVNSNLNWSESSSMIRNIEVFPLLDSENNEYIAFYRSNYRDGASYALMARQFDQSGTIGRTHQINMVNRGDQSDYKITLLKDKKVLVTYDGAAGGVLARLLDTNVLTKLTREVEILSSTYTYKIVPLSENNFALVWEQSNRLYVRFYNDQIEELSKTFDIPVENSHNLNFVDAQLLKGGSEFVVVWYDHWTNNYTANIWDADKWDRKFEDDTVIFDDNGDDFSYSDVVLATLSGGYWAVAAIRDNGFDEELNVRGFDENCTRIADHVFAHGSFYDLFLEYIYGGKFSLYYTVETDPVCPQAGPYLDQRFVRVFGENELPEPAPAYGLHATFIMLFLSTLLLLLL